jgi:hypothetical protein
MAGKGAHHGLSMLPQVGSCLTYSCTTCTGPPHRATTGIYYEPHGICNGLLFKDFVKGGFDVRGTNG